MYISDNPPCDDPPQPYHSVGMLGKAATHLNNVTCTHVTDIYIKCSHQVKGTAMGTACAPT